MIGAARRAAWCSGTVVGGLTAFGASYLTAIGTAARRADGRLFPETFSTTASTRFRILVPAHDEEALLADSLTAINQLEYPPGLYEVHLVADNCGDRTADVARSHGAIVHERVGGPRGKGPALGWLIEQLVDRRTDDVLVFVDADTVVNPRLLEAFDEHFRDGARVAQGYYSVRNPDGGTGGLRFAAFAVRHYVRPLGRTALGGSAFLYGTGMAMTDEIASAMPWSDALAEDTEMAIRLILAGETIRFVPGAVVETTVPRSRAELESQHRRWEAGRAAVVRSHLGALVRTARVDRQRRWVCLDSGFDLALPPIGQLAAAAAGSSVLTIAAGSGKARVAGPAPGMIAVTLLLVHVLDALRLVGAPREVYQSLLRAPADAIWKSGLLIRLLRNPQRTWVRTERPEGATV